jgi:hypothetical protein
VNTGECIYYTDISDLDVEWLEELKTKVSDSELELEQLSDTVKLELVGGFLGLKQKILLFFWPFLRFLKIQITTGY